jgi:hypothetical protein
MSAAMRCAITAVLLSLSACGSRPKDHGPPPGPEHQSDVRAAMDRRLGSNYRLAEPSAYRFTAPVKDRVAYWLFEPEVPGRNHSFGNVYGWRVDFQVKPHYVGYPEQPESPRMAFFVDGELRGLFIAGGGNAPLGLDKWEALWVDPDWQPARPAAAPR